MVTIGHGINNSYAVFGVGVRKNTFKIFLWLVNEMNFTKKIFVKVTVDFFELIAVYVLFQAIETYKYDIQAHIPYRLIMWWWLKQIFNKWKTQITFHQTVISGYL